jgi:hypothetical protein
MEPVTPGSAEKAMETSFAPTPPVANRVYRVHYRNEYDQVDVLSGTLLHTGLDGFVVVDVDGKRVLLPRDRIFAMRETGT